MTAENFETLLQSKLPTLNDYSQFVLICERFTLDILWGIEIKKQNMHPLLKKVVKRNLEEKIQRENIDNALNKIVQSA